ncbi:MAG: hypothetical protein R3228_11540, partial [Halioglobus sp.]|nr:hypothetical protein [Halioglobus sp.]
MTDAVTQDWLDLLCQMLPEVRAGLFLPAADDNGVAAATHWPPSSPPSTELRSAADMAAQRQAPVSSSRQDQDTPELLLAMPLAWEGQALGVVAVNLAAGAERQGAVQQLLQWGGAWLHLLRAGAAGGGTQAAPLQAADIGPLLATRDPEVLATLGASLLAQKLGLDRAAVGLVRDAGDIALGISDSSGADTRSVLAQQFLAVVEETRAGGDPVDWAGPQGDAQPGREALAQLARASGHHVAARTLRRGEDTVAVVVMEQTSAPAPPVQERFAALASWLGALLAPGTRGGTGDAAPGP